MIKTIITSMTDYLILGGGLGTIIFSGVIILFVVIVVVICRSLAASKRRADSQRRLLLQKNDMGKLLASCKGIDSVKASLPMTFILLIVAGGIIVLGIVLANSFGTSTISVGDGLWVPRSQVTVRLPAYYMILFGSIGGAAAMIIAVLGQCHFAGKTEIYVYEQGVKGIGAGPRFGHSYEDTTTLTVFELKYDAIASVDISSKSFLMVYTAGRGYCIASVNPHHLMDVINRQISMYKNTRMHTLAPVPMAVASPPVMTRNFCAGCGHALSGHRFCSNCGYDSAGR